MVKAKAKSAAPKKDWQELMLQVPMHVFSVMVTKSGLPVSEQRDLNASFRDYRENG